MAEYIDREAFIVDKRWLYCTDCDKRKGKKRGKYMTLYEIGEAPCRSCWVDDMLDEMEVYPAAMKDAANSGELDNIEYLRSLVRINDALEEAVKRDRA